MYNKQLSDKTTASSFADDTRVQRGIQSSEDCSDLQDDLQLIYDWAATVNMKFNSDKFECVRYWSNQTQAPSFQYISPDNKPIEVKTNLRDLGVQLSSSLNFKLHIDNTITAASRLVGWGLRTFRGRSRRVMVTLMKSLVQPKMDFCSQLWSPTDQSPVNKLESVQQHMISRIRDSRPTGLNYWEKLHELRLYLQESRREIYQLILL